ncbi:unnamed protein product, partial [Ostreobium quekettii]
MEAGLEGLSRCGATRTAAGCRIAGMAARHRSVRWRHVRAYRCRAAPQMLPGSLAGAGVDESAGSPGGMTARR